MYDPLTSTYTFSCPRGRDARVPLSAFRTLERLPGAAHPAVYRIEFACECGDEHPGLIAHDDLDWAHLGTMIDRTFRNLMTSHDDPVAAELTELAAGRIGAGEWPWSFFCFLEGRARPVTPSAFTLIAPGGGAFGVAVLCPVCGSVSVNLVTREHVDIRFETTRTSGSWSTCSNATHYALRALPRGSPVARFDERRLDLELWSSRRGGVPSSQGSAPSIQRPISAT
jgi:hypothetical protein